ILPRSSKTPCDARERSRLDMAKPSTPPKGSRWLGPQFSSSGVTVFFALALVATAITLWVTSNALSSHDPRRETPQFLSDIIGHGRLFAAVESLGAFGGLLIVPFFIGLY